MNIPADLEDIRGTIERPLTTDEERVIPDWLDRAWRILQREVSGIPARVDLPDTDPGHLDVDDVKGVLVAMVERKVRNAAGLRSYDADDYNQTVDAALSSGQIYVSDNERASLAPRSSTPSNGFYSVPLASRP